MTESIFFHKSTRTNLLAILSDRCRLDFFRNLVLNELKTFREFRRYQENARLSPFSNELKKINALIRLLKKNPSNIEKILSRVDDLDLSTKHFLNFETKRLSNFQKKTISQCLATENHSTAIAVLESTRKYFREPSGSRYTTEELNLARALVRIYESASGKKFGLGSSSTALGPNYMTPSEQFLFATLKLANKHTTVEGMRERYRAAHRQKKGANNPAT